MIKCGVAELRVPAGVSFADLKLTITEDGDMTLVGAVLMAVVEESGLPPELFTTEHHQNVGELLKLWYAWHLAHDGARDETMDRILAELERLTKLVQTQVPYHGHA